ncbi:aspartate aminotransferase family protein [Roseospira navarrensis]|uniref:Aspartate aminotransferase family protein n=1 Tax=Roseospira navarrensis TaxID=140058 RepID=A0A7X2D4U9_9PROT|nr:aspartate aminotransferase family protein [Roseospira navarrensis]MQX38226.1 aspartate aminotransferase family protein [Roseospira navarrensis]
MTRESRVFHRHSVAAYPVAVAGDGPWLIDAEGRRYLDACGGAAVSCLGHSDTTVREAIKGQVDALAYAHSAFFTTRAAEDLADHLIDKAEALIPDNRLGKVYLVSGGSEAAEAALKLSRQYFLEIGEPQRHRIIARRQSYHGNTLGALSVGGNQWRREPFEPMLMPATHIAPCYPYRDRADGESETAYGERVADELDDTIRRLGPETVAAFIAEPVVGATMGAVPAVPGYLKRIREICDRHGVLLILDEVMCGMGRTGHLFACAEDGISPDILLIAKGLGAGYQPVGAMLCATRIHDAIRAGSGFFQHGHTYLGHVTACAGALAVQRRIEDGGLLDNVRTQGAALREALAAAFGAHPHVGDIRGRGLMLGLELVADRDSKAPFDPALKLNARVKREAMAQGLMCYPMGGTIDGRRGDHIMLAPPFILGPEHIAEIIGRLDLALAAALGSV